MGIANTLYKLSRVLGKTSSVIRDIEVLSTGDPKKIGKRILRKGIYKASGELTRNITKKI